MTPSAMRHVATLWLPLSLITVTWADHLYRRQSARLPADAIHPSAAPSLATCAAHCSRVAGCGTFVFDNGCQLFSEAVGGEADGPDVMVYRHQDEPTTTRPTTTRRTTNRPTTTRRTTTRPTTSAGFRCVEPWTVVDHLCFRHALARRALNLAGARQHCRGLVRDGDLASLHTKRQLTFFLKDDSRPAYRAWIGFNLVNLFFWVNLDDSAADFDPRSFITGSVLSFKLCVPTSGNKLIRIAASERLRAVVCEAPGRY